MSNKETPKEKESVSGNWLLRGDTEKLLPVIGSKIFRVIRNEYSFTLELDNGLLILIEGHTFQDCSLDVSVEENGE